MVNHRAAAAAAAAVARSLAFARIFRDLCLFSSFSDFIPIPSNRVLGVDLSIRFVSVSFFFFFLVEKEMEIRGRNR